MDRKIKKKYWSFKRIVGLIIVFGFIGLLVHHFVLGDDSRKLNVKSERVTVAEVRKGPFLESIPVIGNVIPKKTIYLDAVEGGRVEKIFIEAGTFVEKGQGIMALSNTNLLLDIMNRETDFLDLGNDLRTARMQMEQNRLDLKSQLLDLDYRIGETNRKHEREKKLKEKDIITPEQYENTASEYRYLCKKRELTLLSYNQDNLFRENQIGQIDSSLKRMQTNLKIAKQKLEDLVIKAPVSGHLTSLNAEIGESKKSGERLGQIDVLDGFKVRVPVDEHYLARIHPGQKGEFTFDDITYTVIISKIYPEVVDGRFGIDMAFKDDQPQGIRRGQSLHIRLELGNLSTAVLLQKGGFYQKTGGQWIYVVDGALEHAVKRKIILGRWNPEFFEVLDGLKPGEKVIVSSYDHYGDDIDKLILK